MNWLEGDSYHGNSFKMCGLCRFTNILSLLKAVGDLTLPRKFAVSSASNMPPNVYIFDYFYKHLHY